VSLPHCPHCGGPLDPADRAVVVLGLRRLKYLVALHPEAGDLLQLTRLVATLEIEWSESLERDQEGEP
jgi:hypothetical protein